MRPISLLIGTILLSGFYSCSTKKIYVFNTSDYKASWQYFDLKDTIQGIILRHQGAGVDCGNMAFGSVSIIKTDKDTIRVLDLCNMESIDEGRIITIYPDEKPSFGVVFPTERLSYERNDTIYEMPSKYDRKILKTTWGSLK